MIGALPNSRYPLPRRNVTRRTGSPAGNPRSAVRSRCAGRGARRGRRD